MNSPNDERPASDQTSPTSQQTSHAQYWSTSTSSGTLKPDEGAIPSCKSPTEGRGPGKACWTALRSFVSRHSSNGASRQNDDLEKAQVPDEEMGPIEPEYEKPQMITRSLDTFQTGYPNLATFLDSDENFMVYRRFGYLQSRILLEKQDDLRRLEERLDKLDFDQQDDEPDALFTREAFGQERRSVLSTIEKAFCEYSQLLISAQQLQSFNRPTKCEHDSVLNYMNDPGPVDPEEQKFTLCKEDLITLRPGREHAWLDRAIERILRKLHWGPFIRPLEYVFCPKELQDKKSNGYPIYYGKDRIEGCSAIVVVLMIVFMLILPIYLLYHLVKRTDGAMSAHENAMYMGILLVFTLIFAATMSFFTKARRHEILGAAAAYCAVLVVFLGNLDGSD